MHVVLNSGFDKKVVFLIDPGFKSCFKLSSAFNDRHSSITIEPNSEWKKTTLLKYFSWMPGSMCQVKILFWSGYPNL